MGDQIDIFRLKAFGLMQCRGTIRKKAHFFYGLLQPGGVEKYEFISAGDKDFIPNFDAMCSVVCWDLFTATIQLGIFDELYDAATIEKLKDQVYTLREEHFIEDVYGAHSKLEYKEFLEAIYLRASWVFSASEIRSKLFELANVEIKHLQEIPRIEPNN